jgi:hypothetical protein
MEMKTMSRKKDELKVTFVDSGKRLTENEVSEVRDIMTDIIARYIVKNGIPHNEATEK